MTKLYIMNCKKQDEVFAFRVPELDKAGKVVRHGQLITQTIPKGGQLQVYRDADEPVLRAILAQHARYGIAAAADIDRPKPFINLAYQFDKPFSPNQIMYGFQHNTDVLVDRGREQRDGAAVAISQGLDQRAQDHGGKVREMDLVLVDDTKGDSNTGMDETIRVDAHTGGKPGSKRKAGRAGGRG